VRRRVFGVAGFACMALAVLSLAQPTERAAGSPARLITSGRQLYAASCAGCHGLDGRGVRGSGPSLRGVGAQAVDFYLSTGRMPLDDPGEEPVRQHPAYTHRQIQALVAYVAGSFGGPPIPAVDTAAGNLSAGREAFTSHCAGCHQILGEGGIVTGGAVPDLHEATPTQVAEAMRVGPFLMPRFSERTVDQRTLNDIAAYVQYANHPHDEGGWGIGHLGPIPEGMVAWLIGLLGLVLVTRAIGDRTPE
jgi:ubiquinol-cytochrome c reductase cytochrome c subunit